MTREPQRSRSVWGVLGAACVVFAGMTVEVWLEVTAQGAEPRALVAFALGLLSTAGIVAVFVGAWFLE